ncbi:FHA domain-containing protein [Streptomyces sp. TR06-5]|uniref:FHA domain-containing protein n=1 Tax=unclassified Streptomyces TaxID=2593676 RepID=UPI00399F15F3
MPTCPNGHQSAADDWCEVCGHRMPGPSGPPGAGVPGPPGPGAPPAPPQPAPGHVPQQGGYGYPQPPHHGGPAHGQHGGHPQQGPPQAPPAQPPGGYGYPQAPQQQPPQQHGPGGGYGYPQAPPPDPWGGHGGAPPAQGPGYPAQGGYGYPPHGAPAEAAHAPPAPPPHQAPQQPPPPAPHDTGRQSPPSGDWTLPPPGGAGGPGPQQGGGQGPPQSGSWTAVVAPDREYFAAMMQRSGPEASALNLPAYSAEHELPLTGQQVSIGRRRNSTGESPDIDLGRAPEDPGVSHQHALLVAQPDGSWSVVDQNSTNGTTVNGGEDPIQPFVPVPLRDGDQVHVGAWTTITLHFG